MDKLDRSKSVFESQLEDVKRELGEALEHLDSHYPHLEEGIRCITNVLAVLDNMEGEDKLVCPVCHEQSKTKPGERGTYTFPVGWRETIHIIRKLCEHHLRIFLNRYYEPIDWKHDRMCACPECGGTVVIKRTYNPDYTHYKCQDCTWGDIQSSAIPPKEVITEKQAAAGLEQSLPKEPKEDK